MSPSTTGALRPRDSHEASKLGLVEGLTITELANQLGTTVRALRYYEQIKILRPDRDGSNVRRYGSEARRWAELIVTLRQGGVPLAEILTAARSTNTIDLDQIAALLKARVVVAEKQICTLRNLLTSAETGLL